ncbi:MAG: hypothetical protein AAGA99_20790 [Actinomycetota bacterium]
MARTRISTTVDETLLTDARGLEVGTNDAELMDAALKALLDVHRRIEIDEAYERGYSEHPIDEPDEWGDLVSWSEGAKRA